MEEEQLLNEEQLLLLENLTYLIEDKPMESLDIILNKYAEKELTVGDILDEIEADQLQPDKEYGTYVTGEDWKKLFAAIENDETLMNMKILTVAGDPGLPAGEKREEDSPQEGALSAVFVNEETGEAVVAFRGTAEYEWKDNFLGGAATDAEDGVSTQYQIKALEWYQGLELEEGGYTAITVVGHSKGGNKAKYITLMDTSVTRCVSFDGQGFSDEFYETYAEKIARRQQIITNYNVEYDFVNLLLNDVGETVFCKGYDYGKGKLLEAHCPNTFFRFDEEGNVHIETVEKQAEGMVELNRFLNSYLRTLNSRQKVRTMEFIGEMAGKGFAKELQADMKTMMYIKNHFGVITDLLLYSAEYTLTHIKFTEAIESVFEEFYSEEEIGQYKANICYFLDKYTNLPEVQKIAACVYSKMGKHTKNGEDLKVASVCNPLERNRVFDIDKITALGRQGKVLMYTGSVSCMTWDDGIESLKELVECLPGEARSAILTECLNGITEKFYKEEYETMGEYIYNTATKIAEDIPAIDKEAAEAIDEITEELSASIAVIKRLEGSLNVKPIRNTLGIGGF